MTWVHVLWSGYIAMWMTATDSGVTVAAVWWLVGMAGLALLRSRYPTASRERAASSAAANDRDAPSRHTDI
jgi:hypothetical protein